MDDIAINGLVVIFSCSVAL